MQPTTVAIIGAVLLFALRGKTGTLAPLSNADRLDLAKAACDALNGGTIPTPLALASAVGKAAYPEVSWPPAPMATASHKSVWNQLRDWAEQVAARAASSGVDLCTYLMSQLPGIEVEVLPPTPPSGPEIGPGPLPGEPPPEELPELDVVLVAATPTPGRLYRIQYTDNLLNIAGRAYGPNFRLSNSQRINENAWNRANLVYQPAAELSSTEAAWYPAGKIGFFPPYQTIYIPGPGDP